MSNERDHGSSPLPFSPMRGEEARAQQERLDGIEARLDKLEKHSHPPVDLRPAARAAMDEWFRDMEALAAAKGGES